MNSRLLIRSFVVATVTIAGVIALNWWQVRSLRDDLLDRAHQAEENGDLENAISSLQACLKQVPDDVHTHARLALLLDDARTEPQQKPSVILQLESVLRMDPDQIDVRARLVKAWFQLGRPRDASEHLEILPTSAFGPGEHEFLQAQIHEVTGFLGKAKASYAASAAKSPERLEAFTRLASLHLRANDQKLAAKVCEEMIEANPDSADAFLIHGEFHATSGNFARAAHSFSVARRLDPDDVEPLIAVSLLAGRPGVDEAIDAEAAEADLAAALERTPEDARLHLALARLERASGSAEAVTEWLSRGLAACPADDDLGKELVLHFLSQGRLDEADSTLAGLQTAGAPLDLRTNLESYVSAIRLAEHGRYSESREQLNELALRLTDDDGFIRLVKQSLSACCRALNDVDAEIAALEDLLDTQPPEAIEKPARLRLASLRMRVGSAAEALRDLGDDSQATANLMRAEMQLRDTIQAPAGEQNWKAVEDAVAVAEQSAPDSMTVPVLKSLMYEHRGDVDQARAVLTEAREARPSQVSFYTSAAALELRQGRFSECQQLLDEATRHFGDTVQLRLARLVPTALRSSTDSGMEELLGLGEDLEKFASADQARLLGALADTLLNIGQPEHALSFSRTLCDLQPNQLDAWLLYLESAGQSRQLDEASVALKNIERLESSDGPHGQLGRGILNLLGAQGRPSPSQLAESRELLSNVVKQKPRWHQPLPWLGRIHEIEGNFNRAMEAYSQAIDLGYRPRDLCTRYLVLLGESGQFSAAEKLAGRILSEPDQWRSVDEIRFASELAFRIDQHRKALQLAALSLRIGPSVPENHLWLAELLTSLDRQADAEQVLRAAVERFPSSGDMLVALVRLLTETDRSADAGEVLAAHAGTVSARDASQLATCHELIGQPELAAEVYEQALLLPDINPEVILDFARFRRRTGRTHEAKNLYWRVLDADLPSLSARQIRRELAELLGTGHYRDFQSALSLVDSNLSQWASPVDSLLKARLLAQQTHGPHVAAAIEILNQVEATAQLAPSDQRLLAQLHERNGDLIEAHQRWRKIRESTRDLELLAECVRRDLSLNQLRYADAGLRRMRRMAPDDERVVLYTALLTAQRGNTESTGNTLQSWLKQAADRIEEQRRALDVFLLLNQAHQNVAAKEPEIGAKIAAMVEAWLAHLKDNRREALATYFSFLIRTGQIQRAFEVFQELMLESPSEAAPLSRALVRTGQLEASQNEAIGTWFEQQLSNADVELPVLHAAGSYFFHSGRHDQEEQVYRLILKRNAQDVHAMNNLAWLLAVQGRSLNEAQSLISQSLALGGPRPSALDTQVVVLNAAGKPTEAVRIAEASRQDSHLPEMSVHLAQSYQELGRRAEAKRHFNTALRMGFTEERVHPLEQQSFQRLTAWLSAE